MKYYILLLTFYLISSCSSDSLKVITTKSGLYGSIEGNFVAQFISKPKVRTDHFQMGNTEFDMYTFQHILGNYNFYSVSFVDYPKEILKSWDTEQLFDQSIKTMTAQFDDMKVFNKTENFNSKYDKEIIYTLYPSNRKSSTYIKTKLIREGNRIYSVYFACTLQNPGAEKIDAFINSFKLLKKNK